MFKNKVSLIKHHVVIDGWLHLLIASTLGEKQSLFYMGYECTGYSLYETMHIDSKSYRPMTEADRPSHKNVVVPFRKKS